uniref:Uncharacterized protein n=1 Tax=Macrostomum lignano TaxID=282301 RepID=A0A1I8FB49_9PLAT
MSNKIEAPQTAGPQRLLLLLLASLLAVAVGASKPAATSRASTERTAFFELCSRRAPSGCASATTATGGLATAPSTGSRPNAAASTSLTAHLASVTSMFEDSFIAKLTYCRSTWLGYYARENLQWINRVYHDRHPYVCKVKTSERNRTLRLSERLATVERLLLHSNAHATYIEADFYCRGRNAFVASLHQQPGAPGNEPVGHREPRLPIRHLDRPAQAQHPAAWTSQPARKFATLALSTDCAAAHYQDFPAWQRAAPKSDDQVTNCVLLLQDEEIKTVPCHTAGPGFVCKKKVVQPVMAGGILRMLWRTCWIDQEVETPVQPAEKFCLKDSSTFHSELDPHHCKLFSCEALLPNSQTWCPELLT